jgi:hypothetical protein
MIEDKALPPSLFRRTAKGCIGWADHKSAEVLERSVRQLMQPRGELNPGGLAGQMLYGVLIRIVRKCFIAWKSLEGRELCERSGEE